MPFKRVRKKAAVIYLETGGAPMIINENDKVQENPVELEGAKDVTVKILIGTKEGSKDIIMRYFRIMPGGNSCLHSHNYEHLVTIERGKGVVMDENRNERV